MCEDVGIHLSVDANVASTNTQQISATTVKVALEWAIDLRLLRKQKRALVSITEGTTVTHEQEDATEGMLNMLDFIQDSILEQGLATEEEIFPRLPQLFGPEPPSAKNVA